jgi:acetyl-CoA carboxylase biotin carboxyl carrier protein
MIDLDFLKSLIQAIDESSIDSIEIERGGTKVRVSKTPQAVAAAAMAAAPAPVVAPAPAPAAPAEAAAPAAEAPPAPPAAASNLVDVYSPMVGTFYESPAPDAPPFAEVGTSVSAGDTLCIIEAMKLMNELESEVTGVIREVCVGNAEPVEYGQLLFRVEPA